MGGGAADLSLPSPPRPPTLSSRPAAAGLSLLPLPAAGSPFPPAYRLGATRPTRARRHHRTTPQLPTLPFHLCTDLGGGRPADPCSGFGLLVNVYSAPSSDQIRCGISVAMLRQGSDEARHQAAVVLLLLKGGPGRFGV